MRFAAASDFRDAFISGAKTAVEMTEQTLAEIARQDGEINAFLCVDREGAMRTAESLDRRRSRGSPLGSLAAVPVAVKDNICTRGLKTTAGSKILADFLPPYDAAVVERLRQSDAIIIGKTNLDEFGMGSSCENSAFFPTKNPWASDRVPGGSSGGSAAAVAAGMLPLALGSDTGGSIRQPASLCGLTGLKPTYGMVSRYGLIAFASSLDQIGPIARDARDCAELFRAISGFDSRDATSLRLPSKAGMELAEDLRGIRIGYPREHRELKVEPAVQRKVDEAVKVLESLGAEVVELAEIREVGRALATYQILATAEASSNLARYDGTHFGARCDRARNPTEMMARSRALGFGPEVKRRILLGTFVLSSGYFDAYYRKAQAARAKIRDGFLRAFSQVDAVVGPTSPIPAFPLGERVADPLTMYAVDVFTLAANLVGCPALSMPCGFTGDNLPIGVQLAARHGEDGLLLRMAATYQRATDFHRITPTQSPGS